MQTQTANFKQKILFTKLFTQSEELTLKHIKLILQRMFEHADDTLFALAEKTNSTKESTVYFDSMRIIRLKRIDIETQHFDYIKQAFAEVSKGDIQPQDEVNTLDSLTMDDLSIIEDADLEENIAIKNIVSKVSGQCGRDLSAVEKRLSHILDCDISASNNPIGPSVIAHTFMKSATALDIELKVSLIILKLFEQEIITGILPLLNEVNTLFIDAKVLPEFKHTIQKSEHLDNPNDVSSVNDESSTNNATHNNPNALHQHPAQMNTGNFQSNQAGPDQVGAQMGAQMSGQMGQAFTGTSNDTSIGHFQQLLAQHQGQISQNAGTPISGNNVHPISPNLDGQFISPNQDPTHNQNNAQNTNSASSSEAHSGSGSTHPGHFAVSTPQFIGSLTQLQNIPIMNAQQSSSVSINEDGEEIEEISMQSSSNLKDFVIQQLQQQDENFSVNHINPVDQDVIDVVSMLFEFILEDKDLPNAAKAHIARLQIPLLKAAIIDTNFFSTNKNSARTLLNTLAHAALGIVDESDLASENLLNEIERIVDTINDDFEDDLNIFDTQLSIFKEFLEQHDKQEYTVNDKIEKKFKQKEDNALAYHWVEDTLEEILRNKHLPDVIIDLINGPWKKVMLNTYLNNGQNSDTWKNQVRFIDVLEWSIQPKHESLDRQKLAKIIGQLVMTLRNGLQVIQIDNEDIQAILLQLEPYHLASVKGLSLKDHLASLTPHEAFLFESENISQDKDNPENASPEKIIPLEDENVADVIPLSTTETTSIEDESDNTVEEIVYETDENYESNLSLEEIDQTILTMEEELRSLESIAQSISDDIESLESSSEDDSTSNQIDATIDTPKDILSEPFDAMDDDFSLLGDNQDLSEDNSFNKLITEDIILSGYSTEQNETPDDQPQDEYLELARHLEQGNWVEFLDDDKNITRAKLAWKSELLGEYTFLNWKFDVVADKTLYGLAADLRRGSATIIDEIPLVDRALSAVMSSLTPASTSSQSN